MRTHSALLIVALGLGLEAGAWAQTTCTGLQCQQTTCSGNTTTSISGTVYAPNGTDPLPNVGVYIPNGTVQLFTPGVSCPALGTPPSGSPLVGTTTDVSGNFTLTNVPVGTNIPVVAISGRWRVQGTVDTTGAVCGNTVFSMNMPQNHTQGDIPLIAIATGSADQVECVLLKMGISQSEFTDPGGTGRINLYGGGTNGSGGGVTLNGGSSSQDSLMSDYSTLSQYDVLMLPCEGSPYPKPDAELQNLIAYANNGGRIYTSHYGYAWMYQNPPFDSVANWTGSSVTPNPSSGMATVDTSFTDGQTLTTWLQNVNATTTLGQMALNTLRIDQNGVSGPSQSWLTLNNPDYNNPVMQFVFNTPIGAPAQQQCGRVLYNEYHVETSSVSSGETFPNECNTTVAMTPQEKLLEYMLFDVTNEGEQPSITPTAQDFGQVVIGYTSAAQTFTWTNNSIFAATVSSAAISGDTEFAITQNTCNSVAVGANCAITVVFSATALGARAATLTVVSSGTSLTVALTGTGIPGFTLSPNSLSYGNVDVGASFATQTQTLTLTSLANIALPVPQFTAPSEYSINTAGCGSMLGAGASCPISVTFLPTTTGAQNGTFGVSPANSPGPSSLLFSGVSAAVSGTGVDFTISLNPTGGSVVAGDGTSTTATLTPIAGFSAPLTVSCWVAVSATASTCGLSTASVAPTSATTDVVSFTTTSQYTVIGYSGYGGEWMWLAAAASGWLVWRRLRRGRAFLPHLKIEIWGTRGLLAVLLGVMGLWLTGCTGKLPDQNPAWTSPGNYTVTVSATDGFLVRSATYNLTVR